VFSFRACVKDLKELGPIATAQYDRVYREAAKLSNEDPTMAILALLDNDDDDDAEECLKEHIEA